MTTVDGPGYGDVRDDDRVAVVVAIVASIDWIFPRISQRDRRIAAPRRGPKIASDTPRLA